MLNPIQIKVDEEMERLIVEIVIQDFKNAEQVRTKTEYGMNNKGVAYTFDTRLKSLRDLWKGNREVKSVPWKYCSNSSMKIAMAILEMLHARLFAATWNEDLNKFKAVEKNDVDRAERVTKLMYWWIKVHTKMRSFFDGWVKVIAGIGDGVVEGSWDIKYMYNGEVEETPITDEFGAQLYEKDGNPSVNKQKKFKIIEKTKVEIIPKEDIYFQEGQKSLDEDPVIIKMKYFYSDLEQMETEGKAVNVQNLLKTEIEKGLAGELSSAKEENRDILREVKLRGTPVEVLKEYLHIDIDRDGFPEDVRVLVDPDRRIFLGGVMIKDLTKSGTRPLRNAKFNDYIDKVDELEGLGVLETVQPLADEIDAIYNQITDANTLSVLRPGFYDPSGELRPATLTIAPNKLIPVPDPQRNVYFPDFQIPTERLMLALRGVLEFIERLTGASSYVMGKESEVVGGSGTATRTQAIVSAAEQRFSLPATRLKAGAASILNMVLDLIQLNLPQGLESRILGEDGKPIFGDNELTQDSISGEFDCYILDDASMGSKQIERQLASLLYSVLFSNPIVATDPAKLWVTTAELLKAHDYEPEKYLGPAPEMKDMDTPEDENTKMLQGDFESVKPLITENHMQHMFAHQQLASSPTLPLIEQRLGPQMINQILGYNQQHIQEHMMMMQQMMALMQKFGGQNGGNTAGAIAPSQGAGGVVGMENQAGPAGEVAREQGKGESSFSPIG